MKINIPKINKTDINVDIKFQSVSKMHLGTTESLYYFDDDCYDDCGVCYDCYFCEPDCCDCRREEDVYIPDDYDAQFCACDCDDCYDCDCRTNTGIKGTYYIIGVRYLGQTHGCYYYRCHENEYKLGDTVIVPTSNGNKTATVVFVRTYYNSNELPVNLDILLWAPKKQNTIVNQNHTYISNNIPTTKYTSNNQLNKQSDSFLEYILAFLFSPYGVVLAIIIFCLIMDSCS